MWTSRWSSSARTTGRAGAVQEPRGALPPRSSCPCHTRLRIRRLRRCAGRARASAGQGVSLVSHPSWTSKPSARAASASSASCVAMTRPSKRSRTRRALARWMASSDSDQSGESGAGPRQDSRVDRDDRQGVARFQDIRTVSGDHLIVQSQAYPCPIDRPQTLKTQQLTGDTAVDARPTAETPGLAEDHPEHDRAVDVGVHRSGQRSRRSSSSRSVDRWPIERSPSSIADVMDLATRRDDTVGRSARARRQMRAIGRPRSVTSTSEPASTARRFAERSSLTPHLYALHGHIWPHWNPWCQAVTS